MLMMSFWNVFVLKYYYCICNRKLISVSTIMEDVSILVIIQFVVATTHAILAISLTLTIIIVMIRLLTPSLLL